MPLEDELLSKVWLRLSLSAYWTRKRLREQNHRSAVSQVKLRPLIGEPQWFQVVRVSSNFQAAASDGPAACSEARVIKSAVPPAFSIFSRALFVKRWAETLNALETSPVPSTTTSR